MAFGEHFANALSRAGYDMADRFDRMDAIRRAAVYQQKLDERYEEEQRRKQDETDYQRKKDADKAAWDTDERKYKRGKDYEDWYEQKQREQWERGKWEAEHGQKKATDEADAAYKKGMLGVAWKNAETSRITAEKTNPQVPPVENDAQLAITQKQIDEVDKALAEGKESFIDKEGREIYEAAKYRIELLKMINDYKRKRGTPPADPPADPQADPQANGGIGMSLAPGAIAPLPGAAGNNLLGLNPPGR